MSEYVVGLDLGGTKILSLCLDRDMNVVGRDRRETGAEDGPEAVIERMAQSARAAAGERPLRAIGVSAPGPSDPTHGIVTTPPNLPGWHDVPLARLISERLGLSAWIENDANAAALAEFKLGAGRGTQHMVLVAAGTGIGGGLVLDGKLYHGASGGAGEIGHMQLDPLGRQCNCGRKGCLEALASGVAMNKAAIEIAQAEPDGMVARLAGKEGEEPDARILDLAAEQGDKSAMEAIRKAGVYLGAGLANLINIFNPNAIVVAGSLRKSSLYFDTAVEIALRESFPQHAGDVRIVEAELGDDAPAMGAALIAWENLDAPKSGEVSTV
jgi:glucokinase